MGELLASKVQPETWLKLAPQLSKLDRWTDTDRTAEDANADDDAVPDSTPEDILHAERALKQFLENGPQAPADCLSHVIDRLGKTVSLHGFATGFCVVGFTASVTSCQASRPFPCGPCGRETAVITDRTAERLRRARKAERLRLYGGFFGSV